MINRMKEQKMEPESEAVKVAKAIEGVMLSLSQVMEEEMTLLAKQDMAALEAIRVRKNKLISDCETNIGTLAQRPDILKDAPQDVRDRLKQAGDRLNQSRQRNMSAFEAAISATKTLMQTVVDAARSGTKRTDCYADPRKNPLMLGAYSPTCEPVAYCRSV